MLKTQLPGLYILETESKGRGVYTSTSIPKGSLIEICPCILLSTSDTQKIHETLLHDYYFLWDTEKKTSVIALGFGSLYNHSRQPNAQFTLNYDDQTIVFVAIEEIFREVAPSHRPNADIEAMLSTASKKP